MSQKEFISSQNGVLDEAEGVRWSRMLKPALWGPVHQSGWNHTPRELLRATLTTELLKPECHFCQPKASMENCDFKTPERMQCGRTGVISCRIYAHCLNYTRRTVGDTPSLSLGKISDSNNVTQVEHAPVLHPRTWTGWKDTVRKRRLRKAKSEQL